MGRQRTIDEFFVEPMAYREHVERIVWLDKETYYRFYYQARERSATVFVGIYKRDPGTGSEWLEQEILCERGERYG